MSSSYYGFVIASLIQESSHGDVKRTNTLQGRHFWIWVSVIRCWKRFVDDWHVYERRCWPGPPTNLLVLWLTNLKLHCHFTHRICSSVAIRSSTLQTMFQSTKKKWFQVWIWEALCPDLHFLYEMRIMRSVSKAKHELTSVTGSRDKVDS